MESRRVAVPVLKGREIGQIDALGGQIPFLCGKSESISDHRTHCE